MRVMVATVTLMLSVPAVFAVIPVFATPPASALLLRLALLVRVVGRRPRLLACVLAPVRILAPRLVWFGRVHVHSSGYLAASANPSEDYTLLPDARLNSA